MNNAKMKVIKRCRFDEIKVNMLFRFLGLKTIWFAEKVTNNSIWAGTGKRSTEFSFDERYRSKSMFSACKGDRQVEILEYID